MAYFLGRDCAVYITTEDTLNNSGAGAFALVNTASAAVTFADASGSTLKVFAGIVSDYDSAPAIKNVTGVDLSIGAVDEDITYIGKRQVTKAEIKKETTVSLTRKKDDITWDGIFNNGGRQGCANGVENSSLQEPTINTGYRIHVVLSGSTDVFSVRGCCVQSHTVSVNADGTSEETMEFMTYITPKVGSTPNVDDLTTAEL